MKKYIVYQVDSFTKDIFKGNPAGVVYNADGLSQEQMQMIARELNNSETAFLLSSDCDDCNGYFVFTFDSDSRDTLTYSRMFAPAIGINEDPVTGNANGPLGAYLVSHKLVDTSNSEFCFKGKQGEAINRLGTVEVKVKIENNKPITVQVAREAVVVFKTEIEI